MPRIDVTSGPIDGPFALGIEGCVPDGEVIVTASLDDPQGHSWRSQARFRSDANGRVAEADAGALVWSMEPMGPKVCFDESTVAPLRIRLEAAGASATVERWFLAEGCTATPAEGVVGTLFLPAGDGPFPGVLIMGGSAGKQVFSAQCAALLAGHGYAALSLAYFGLPGLPEQLVDIPLEYFAQAMAWLRAQPKVEDAGVAVIGRSRGGELALLLAATFPEVRSVVGYCPSDVVWGGIRNTSMVDASAWSHHARPVPHLTPRMTPALQQAVFGQRPIALRKLFEEGEKDPAQASAAVIPVENIRGPVLLFSGDQDRMWPAEQMCESVIRRLAAHQHPHAYTHHCYPGAGHLLRAPCLPTTILDGNLAVGGSAPEQARANRDSWTEVLRTLS